MPTALSIEVISSIAVAVGASALAAAYISFRRDSRPVPPGPRPLPIIGNLLDIPTRDQYQVYADLSRTYGSELVYLSVLGTDILVINSAKAAAALLGHKSAIYSDRPRMPMIGELAGLGWHLGFMPQGDEWRAHRKIFAHEFTPSHYRDQELKWAKTLLQNLLETPKNFVEHLQHMASGLILETTFGLQVQPSGQPDPFIAAAKQAVEAMVGAGLFGSHVVDFLPALKYVPSWLPFAGFKRKANRWHKSADIAAHVPFDIFKKGLATAEVPSIGSRVLSSGEAVDETAVRQTLAAMFASGSAATVSALTTFILAMRLFPAVQVRAQKELDEVLGGRLPNFSDEPNLPYITAIIRELGRWNTVVPLAFPHMLSSDDTYNGYHFKAGTVVYGNSWAILHDPAVYRNPQIFKPDRFLTKDGKLDPDIKDPDVIWGFGRRACPARKMATDTMFITIASVLATFTISSAFDSNGTPITPVWERDGYGSGLLRYPKEFICTIKPRSAAAAALISED